MIAIGARSGNMIWVRCAKCDSERWISFQNHSRSQTTGLCTKCYNESPEAKRVLQHCLAEAHNQLQHKPKSSLRDGCYRTSKGYIIVRLKPDNFFFAMAGKKNGNVFEHRLIMAQHLGRCLHSWELVHHKNGIRDDNPIENLQLVTDDRHMQITILERRIKLLEKRVTILEAENTVLRSIPRSLKTT